MSQLRPLPAPPIDAQSNNATGDSCAPAAAYECDLCGASFTGRPAGSGLLMWSRGDEMRFEEPPLCESCGEQLVLGALFNWSQGFDDEG